MSALSPCQDLPAMSQLAHAKNPEKTNIRFRHCCRSTGGGIHGEVPARITRRRDRRRSPDYSQPVVSKQDL
jgi:hypothetical protein